MRKVIKIFLTVFSAIVLAAIVLPLAAWLMLYLESVQTAIVRQVSQSVSRKLETTVTFDRVHIRLFNAVELDGLYVEDYRGDTLVYAGRMGTGINPWALLRNELQLSDVEFSDGNVNVVRYADGSTNMGQVLAKLQSETPQRIVVRATSLDMRDIAFTYRNQSAPPAEAGTVDFNDLAIDGLNLSARDISIDGGDAAFRVRRMSLTEKSGFALSSMTTGRIIAEGGKITGEDIALETPDSEFAVERLAFDTASGALDVALTSKRFSSHTAAYFAHGLKGKTLILRDLDAAIDGTPDDLRGHLRAHAADSTSLSTQFRLLGMAGGTAARITLDTLSARTNGRDIAALTETFAGNPQDTLLLHLERLGRVTVKGHFDGWVDNFHARAEVATSQGDALMNLAFSPAREGADGNTTAFAGDVAVRDFQLGAILPASGLGMLSLSSTLDGSYSYNDLRANAVIRLDRLDYNNYPYHDITLDGRFVNREFNGHIASRDPNADFTFDGTIDLNDSIPRYDFAMRLRNADLARLGFNERDSVARVAFNAHMACSGSTFDNLNGEVAFNDLRYVNHVDTVATGRITITSRNSVDDKEMKLRSSFADIDFRSRMSYAGLKEYARGTLLQYLPSLSENAPCLVPSSEIQTGDAESYSALTVNVKQANNVAGIFVPGLIIAEDTRLSFTFNPAADTYALKCRSEYLERGNTFISKLDINSRNDGDSLALFVRADEIYALGFLVPEFSLVGGARDNKVSASARFMNEAREQSALVGAVAELSRDSVSGSPVADIRFTPSYFMQGDERWNIYSRGIRAARGSIEARDFTISGAGQQLRLNGTASAVRSDTLRLTMRNFDINPLANAINTGFDINGRASGHADIISLLKGGFLHADIVFDSLDINSVAAPAVRFESAWDFQREGAGAILSRCDNGQRLVEGYFFPEHVQYGGRANLKGVDLSLLDVLWEDVMSRTSGTADATLSFSGQKRQLKMNGTIDVQGVRTRVDFLNVDYSIDDLRVTLADNVMSFAEGTVRDPSGNAGDIDMCLDLNRLNNVQYTVNVRPRDMLVLNTGPAQNEMFYGRVFASGTASIDGSKRGLSMNVTAATSAGSEFYMPLSDKTDMGDSDFVTFVRGDRQRQRMDSTEYNLRRREIMAGNRRNRRIENRGDNNFNLTLDVRPNTLAELLIDPQTGHTVRARGDGRLTLHINPRTDVFTMYGDYRINEGTYLFTLENIIEKPFAVEPGSSIQWTGDPVNALLDISAVYRLRTSLAPATGGSYEQYSRVRVPVECRLMLTERLNTPTLAFNITAPSASTEVQSIVANFLNTQEMMATQFFFLLATGSFYDYEGSQGNIGVATGAATAFDFLSNQFSNWISSDRFNIGIRYRPQSETTSDEWGIDFSQQLLGNRLLLEVEGNYDTGNNTSAAYQENIKNFTGDFYLTALLDRTGNTKAKLFSRTIDRFDENQGLQESGIGIYFTEDFNTFGDILRGIKERFTGERRRRRRQLRELERQHEEVMSAGKER